MNHDHLPLGQETAYPERYDAGLLCPVPRAANRAALGIDAGQALPFFGDDLWTAYELSWLNLRGKPVVAVGECRVPCDSPNLIESKSFKLYLNSLNQHRLGDIAEAQALIRQDVSAAAGSPVQVRLWAIDDAPRHLLQATTIVGQCIDGLDVSPDHYEPEAALLQPGGTRVVEECLYSHLLKSNCPVTGQPDWATLVIEYRGRAIDHEALLLYLISYRNHQGFHEHCVEQIFEHVRVRCRCEQLSVYARYTRRGGLDINPFRTTVGGEKAASVRMLRQ